MGYAITGFLTAVMAALTIAFGCPSIYLVGRYDKMAKSLQDPNSDHKKAAKNFIGSFKCVIMIKFVFALVYIYFVSENDLKIYFVPILVVLLILSIPELCLLWVAIRWSKTIK